MRVPAAVFRHYLPGPQLRPYVCGYMWFTLDGEEPERTVHRFHADGRSETYFNSADPLLHRMFPGAYTCLTFNFGDPWTFRQDASSTLELKTSWVMGATTRSGISQYGRHAEALGVMFHAGQAHLFLNTSAESLTDRMVALDDLWGSDARAFEAQLAGFHTPREKIRVLEAELLRRLRASRTCASLQPLARWIEDRRGDVTVARLSELTGVSRQHLARRFKQEIGVSPKQFCRFVRFHALVKHAYFARHLDWAAIAAEFGYYDQAHLSAEFKEFTGLRPRQFFPRPLASPASLAAD